MVQGKRMHPPIRSISNMLFSMAEESAFEKVSFFIWQETKPVRFFSRCGVKKKRMTP